MSCYSPLSTNLERKPTRLSGDVWRVLNLGAGVQSTTILLMSLRDLLPRFDVAIFSDTQYEPNEVYDHLAWLEQECAKHDQLVVRITRGNLRQDAIEFRQNRQSADGKRHANIPAFVRNPNGKAGMMKRQCTSEYKIRPIEQYIRRELLDLRPRKRMPRALAVEQWFGISADEGQRCAFAGRYKNKKVKAPSLFGDVVVKKKVWIPEPWRLNVYPLCGWSMTADRKVLDLDYLPVAFQRSDCFEWLSRYCPGRKIPRSACICCPFRSNKEWKRMRDEDPTSWADAVAFDEEIRLAETANRISLTVRGKERQPLAGVPYLHSTLMPLHLVDLEERDSEAVSLFGVGGVGGCGAIRDGKDGFCGV